MSEKAEPTIDELRQSAAAVKKIIAEFDVEIKTLKENRAKAAKEFRAIIGKIETKVASGVI